MQGQPRGDSIGANFFKGAPSRKKGAKKGAFFRKKGAKKGQKKGAPLFSDKHLLLYLNFFSFHISIAFVYQKCPIFALLTGGGEYRKILAWAQGSF